MPVEGRKRTGNGASLARLEARVALEELLDELPRRARSEPRLEYVDSFLVRGPSRLPLRRAAQLGQRNLSLNDDDTKPDVIVAPLRLESQAKG